MNRCLSQKYNTQIFLQIFFALNKKNYFEPLGLIWHSTCYYPALLRTHHGWKNSCCVCAIKSLYCDHAHHSTQLQYACTN
jgi:hypothetical protein